MHGEVLSFIASGQSRREVAGELFVTLHRVKWYLKGIFGKLHVANRAQAIARAQELAVLRQSNPRADSIWDSLQG